MFNMEKRCRNKIVIINEHCQQHAIFDMGVLPVVYTIASLVPLSVLPERETRGLIESFVDQMVGTPVATLSSAWRYRVSAGTG